MLEPIYKLKVFISSRLDEKWGVQVFLEDLITNEVIPLDCGWYPLETNSIQSCISYKAFVFTPLKSKTEKRNSLVSHGENGNLQKTFSIITPYYKSNIPSYVVNKKSIEYIDYWIIEVYDTICIKKKAFLESKTLRDEFKAFSNKYKTTF